MVGCSVHAPVRTSKSATTPNRTTRTNTRSQNNQTPRGSQAIRGRTSQIGAHRPFVWNIIFLQPTTRISRCGVLSTVPYRPRLAAAASVGWGIFSVSLGVFSRKHHSDEQLPRLAWYVTSSSSAGHTLKAVFSSCESPFVSPPLAWRISATSCRFVGHSWFARRNAPQPVRRLLIAPSNRRFSSLFVFRSELKTQGELFVITLLPVMVTSTTILIGLPDNFSVCKHPIRGNSPSIIIYFNNLILLPQRHGSAAAFLAPRPVLRSTARRGCSRWLAVRSRPGTHFQIGNDT